MIEAVGEQYMDQYFDYKKVLNDNGTAAIQGIVIKNDLFDRYRTNEDFIQKYIFPGGFLPSISFMENLIKKNNLKLEKINSYSTDYARTLATWRENFLGVWEKLVHLDLMIILSVCGNFTFLIVKVVLNRKILT